MNDLREGIVVDTNDPQQMGRLKMWVPAVDGDLYNIDDLPWGTYVTPLGGQTRDYPAGPTSAATSGLVSYGFWAVPKIGACCIVGFLYSDPNRRVYLGSYFRDHGNRSLPVGRNRNDINNVPVSDTYEAVEPQSSNLKAQFNGKLDANEARTRGAYERAIAQDKTDKDGTEGYQANLVEPKDDLGNTQYDPQTYVLTTPGRHALIFQDHPSTGRVRIKSAAGHQIILDDANERIYVSTARGASWFEMDQDGRIHVYGADSFSLSTGGDLNLTAAGSFNVQAGADVNIQAGKTLRLAACGSASIGANGLNLQSTAGFNILSAGPLLQTAPQIHLNGPSAGAAECPNKPNVVPTHEPWTRKASKGTRNTYWKP